MKDNRGITLVELLVSMAIFSIVATILASITSMAIKFYSSEKVDAGMQYEGQIALNSIMDAVMQTNGIAIVNDTITVADSTGTSVTKNVTKGLFLGEFYTNGSNYQFEGKVILGDYDNPVFSLYMMEITAADYVAGATFTGKSTVDETMTEIADKFDLFSESTKKSHLLAERISGLLVTPTPDSVSSGVSYNVFYNPFSVDIVIDMETRTPKGVEKQTVRDKAMIRNTLDVIYYGGIDYENVH